MTGTTLRALSNILEHKQRSSNGGSTVIRAGLHARRDAGKVRLESSCTLHPGCLQTELQRSKISLALAVRDTLDSEAWSTKATFSIVSGAIKRTSSSCLPFQRGILRERHLELELLVLLYSGQPHKLDLGERGGGEVRHDDRVGASL